MALGVTPNALSSQARFWSRLASWAIPIAHKRFAGGDWNRRSPEPPVSGLLSRRLRRAAVGLAQFPALARAPEHARGFFFYWLGTSIRRERRIATIRRVRFGSEADVNRAAEIVRLVPEADIQPDQPSRDEVRTAEQKPRQQRPRSPR